MIAQQEVGDEYIKFRETVTNKIVGEVYALSLPDKWRVRIPNQDDVDLPSKDEAVAHALKILEAMPV